MNTQVECNHINTGRYMRYGETYVNDNGYEMRTAFERCARCNHTISAKPETLRYVGSSEPATTSYHWGIVP